MPQIFYFLLKVIICSGLLFGYYHLFLRNKVFHAYNRYYLLCAVMLSLTVPLFQFDIYNSKAETQLQPIQMLQVVNSSDAYIEEVITTSHTQNVGVSDLLLTGYIAIALVFCVSFIMLLFRVYALIRKSEKNEINNIILINSSAEGTPFSFFRYLFWNNQIDIDTETGRHIFSHELAHIRERHSLDKIFLNIVLIICWINPFFWLIRRELNMIHEFIADKKAVGQYDTAVLASMIIQTAYPKHNFLITNHFFYSPIKRRLIMLAKYKSTRTSYFTRILALPVLFLLIAAFTFKAKNVLQQKIEKDFIVVIDAGHGGQDDGAKAVDGTYEKDLNLALAKKIKELNTNEKIKIILTRETDIYQKPQEKAQIANDLKADLFISIHAASSQEKFRDVTSGMEVFVSKDNFSNSAPSKIFASAVINTFSSNYKLKVLPNPVQRPMGVWVLQASNCPAVLIEAGYISNKKDKAYLTSAEGMETFAANLLSSINKYVHEVDQLNVSSLKPTLLQGQVNVIMIKDHKPDTLPKNKSATEVTVIDNAEFIIRSNQTDRAEHSIIVIGERVYDLKMLNNKVITGRRARVYGKNNKFIIGKYGKRAMDGAIIFENAAIEDLATGKYDVVVDQANQSVLTDASQRLNEKILDRNNKDIEITQLKQNLNTNSVRIHNALDSLNQPLYLLDGEKILLPTLKALDPNQIKSVNVLKGATAELQYGTEAKNGAILIATKKTEGLVASGQHSDAGEQSDNLLFTKVEIEPEFPGGLSSFDRYMGKYKITLTSAQDGLESGKFTATIQFIVGKDGSLSNIISPDYPSSKTVQHLMEILKKGPKWTPAKHNGEVVRAIKTLRIPFTVL